MPAHRRLSSVYAAILGREIENSPSAVVLGHRIGAARDRRSTAPCRSGTETARTSRGSARASSAWPSRSSADRRERAVADPRARVAARARLHRRPAAIDQHVRERGAHRAREGCAVERKRRAEHAPAPRPTAARVLAEPARSARRGRKRRGRPREGRGCRLPRRAPAPPASSVHSRAAPATDAT